MPNLTQSAALLACFFVMGIDTTALDEITAYTPSYVAVSHDIAHGDEVSTVVECDTDTDCMEKNPSIDPNNWMGE